MAASAWGVAEGMHAVKGLQILLSGLSSWSIWEKCRQGRASTLRIHLLYVSA